LAKLLLQQLDFIVSEIEEAIDAGVRIGFGGGEESLSGTLFGEAGFSYRNVRLQVVRSFHSVSGFLKAPCRCNILSACETMIEFGMIFKLRQDSFKASKASLSRPAPKKMLHAM